MQRTSRGLGKVAMLAFSTCSESIKVNPLGLKAFLSTRGLRLNVQPSGMKAETCEGAKIGGGEVHKLQVKLCDNKEGRGRQGEHIMLFDLF